jgi:Mn-dependent DtxR family transcriptional regulator
MAKQIIVIDELKSYIETERVVTSARVASAFGVTRPFASHVLSSLAKTGYISGEGNTRARKYTLTNAPAIVGDEVSA